MGYDSKETDSLYKHSFLYQLSRLLKKQLDIFITSTWECDFNMSRALATTGQQHLNYSTNGGDIDLFLIEGPAMHQVVERYTYPDRKVCHASPSML